jgi:hypothetical protein
MEAVGGTRMPQGVGRRGRGEPCAREGAGQAVADLPGREGRAARARDTAGEHRGCRRGLETVPWPPGFRDIGGQVHHAIDVPCAVVNADGALRQVDGRPGSATHFTPVEATLPPQQNHGAVPQGIDDLKERADLVLRHGAGEVVGHEKVMAGEPNRGLPPGALIASEGQEPLHPAEAGRDGPWCQWLTAGGLDPGINIRGSRRRQVVIESGLAHCGYEHRETLEGADRGFLHGGRLVAGTSMSPIVGHQALVPGTEDGQPAQLWEFLERWGGLSTRHPSLLLHEPRSPVDHTELRLDCLHNH